MGTKTWERYKGILKFSLLFALIVGVGLTGVCYLFTNQIVRAFLTEASAFDYSVRFARIMLSTSTLFGVFYVLTNALQAMGAAVSSLVINLSRQGLIYILALFILNAMLGINGLAWTQPIADVISIVLAALLYIFVSKKMMQEKADDKSVIGGAVREVV